MLDKNNVSKIIRRRRARERRRENQNAIARLGGRSILIVLSLLITLLLLGAASTNHAYRYYAQRLPEPQSTLVGQSEQVTFYARDGETVLFEIEAITNDAEQWLEASTLEPAIWQAALAAQEASTVDTAVNLAAETIVDDLISTPDTGPFERWVYLREIRQSTSQVERAEWLLNTRYYGRLVYGFDNAAWFYYGRPAAELSIAEAAMLAALAEHPTDTDFESIRVRQQAILARMASFDWLSPTEYTTAQTADVEFIGEASTSPLETLAVQQLEAQFPVNAATETIEVQLTTDYELQNLIECSIGIVSLSDCDTEIAPIAGKALIMVIDPTTGSVRALANSTQGDLSAFPTDGRMLLPFIYLTAFEQGFAPSSLILDVRTAIENDNGTFFIPENADGIYNGPISMRQALSASYEAPALQTISRVGVPILERTLRVVGLETTIGSIEPFIANTQPAPLDLVYAYSLFANGGTMVGVTASNGDLAPQFAMLESVESSDIRWAADDVRQVAVIADATLPYLVTDILADGDERSPAIYTLDSSDRTQWSIAYTSDVVIGIWTVDLDASVHEDLLTRVIEQATTETGINPVTRPPGITALAVCETSGLLPTGICPVVEEVFREGTEPVELDTFYQEFEINSQSGLLATVFTPPQLVEREVFLVLPPEASEWAEQEGLPVPPQSYDVLQAPIPGGDVAITQPESFARLGGEVQIVGNALGEGFVNYRLDYGEGFNPDQWVQIGLEEDTSRTNSLLVEWNTSELDGLYSLRLTVLYEDNRFEEFIAPVTIDNTPPEIQLVAPADGAVISATDEFVTIDTIAIDDIEMERVEFLVDGQLIASRTESPYSDRWIITSPGPHIINAQAVDSTGNVGVSESVTIIVEP